MTLEDMGYRPHTGFCDSCKHCGFSYIKGQWLYVCNKTTDDNNLVNRGGTCDEFQDHYGATTG